LSTHDVVCEVGGAGCKVGVSSCLGGVIMGEGDDKNPRGCLFVFGVCRGVIVGEGDDENPPRHAN